MNSVRFYTCDIDKEACPDISLFSSSEGYGCCAQKSKFKLGKNRCFGILNFLAYHQVLKEPSLEDGR